MSKRVIWISLCSPDAASLTTLSGEEDRASRALQRDGRLRRYRQLLSFGCSIVVHKRRGRSKCVPNSKANSKNTCLYDCAQLKSITCDLGRCKANF